MKTLVVGNKTDLTKSETKICEYLQEYMDSSIYMTVTEIANNCGVGEATVTRFCRKLGFRSFLEFKMTMVQEFQNKGISDEELSVEIILNNDSVEAIGKKVSDSLCDRLIDNLKVLNFNSISDAVDSISNANKIYLVGIGYQGVLAEDMYYKFMDLNLNTYCYRDLQALEQVSKFADEKDVLIIFSTQGDSREINKCTELMKTKNVKVISITENMLSKLARLSDIIISYNPQQIQVSESAYRSNMIEKFIIEILYAKLQFE